MKWKNLAPILLVALIPLPRPGSGQEYSWSVQQRSVQQQVTQGWIGFWFDYGKALVDGEERTVVVVREIVEGSPAEAGGLVVGDTLTHLDGHPISQEVFSSLSRTLEPGDLVRLTVNNQDRPREILVEAAEPPEQLVIMPDAEQVIIHLETLSGNILENLDSLRLSIAGLNLDRDPTDVAVQILRTRPGGSEEEQVGFSFHVRRPFVDTLFFEPEIMISAPEFTMPFEAFVVESATTATLKDDLLRIRKELTGVRREELARQRELQAAIQGPIEEYLRQDEKILEIRAREAQLAAEQEELAQRLRQVSEEELQRQWIEVQRLNEEAFARASRAQWEALEDRRREQEQARERAEAEYEAARARLRNYGENFRSPVLVGQGYILGAMLTPLNPDLAETFSVDRGVFVVQVVEGTPAFDAGLKGGDIIVKAAGEEVASLGDLRFGLGAFQGPVRIQLLRKGNPVEILIQR
jgi:membrane-associated protease RseP (regulator of RpoE activity)